VTLRGNGPKNVERLEKVKIGHTHQIKDHRCHRKGVQLSFTLDERGGICDVHDVPAQEGSGG